jgi:hypothetical protein
VVAFAAGKHPAAALGERERVRQAAGDGHGLLQALAQVSREAIERAVVEETDHLDTEDALVGIHHRHPICALPAG